MKLSRTAAYGIHALVHIARHGDGKLIVGHDTAKATGIPEGFMLRILVALSRAGLLRSMKGPNGGYVLARPAKQITMLDIVEAVDGHMICQANAVSHPPDALDMALETATNTATEIVRKQFGRVTLAELVGGRKKGKADR